MAETFLHTVVAAATEYAIDVLNIVGNEYGWATGSLTTSTSTTTTTAAPGPVNECNECDPAIPDTLYVTFAGLSGDFASFNGKHTLTWVGGYALGCNWRIAPFGFGDGGLYYDVYNAPDAWRVWISSPEDPSHDPLRDCARHMKMSADYPCDPTMDCYVVYSCDSGRCFDTDSCADSAGATCVVSYV